MKPTLSAGKLRHCVRIERRTSSKDPATGIQKAETWATLSGAERLPAEIAPLSARELIAAQSTQSGIDCVIRIRFFAGITAAMRAVDVDSGALYDIKGVLPDPESGIEYVRMPCVTGMSRG